MRSLHSYLLAIAFSVVVACNSGSTSDVNETSANDSATYKCDDKCVITFKPNEQTIKRKLEEDKNHEFTEVVSDHDHYADELKEILKKTDIRHITSTARYITVDNGTSKKTFDTHNKDYVFGVILTKPNAEPVIHRGIFTDLEYRHFMQQYFKE